MKSPDKFLIGIIIGVVILLAVVFGVILTRSGEEYQAEDTPEGVAHNYLLAMQNEDYTRAYGYLSPNLKGYPESAIEFKRHVERDRWRFRTDSSISLAVESSFFVGDGSMAYVNVRETTFYSRDLFASSQRSMDFEIFLVLEDGQWKIMDSDFYFSSCWTNYPGCK